MISALRQELVAGIKSVRRAPRLSAAIILSIGLCVGVNGALLRLVTRTLVSPPVGLAAPTEVRRLYLRRRTHLDPPEFQEYFTRNDLDALNGAISGRGVVAAFYSRFRAPASIDGNDESVSLTYASSGLLTLAGARPLLGQEPLLDGEVMVSYAYWQRRFGAARDILGRSIVVDTIHYVVVGVLQPPFAGFDLQPTDLWMSLASLNRSASPGELRAATSVRLVARLSPSANERLFGEHLSTAYRNSHLDDQWPDPNARIVIGSVLQSRGPIRSGEASDGHLALMIRLNGVALLALGVATLNLMSILLAKVLMRRREFGVRSAIGATRRRLVMTVVIEALILGVLSGLIALITAAWTTGLFRAALLPNAPRIVTDGSVREGAIIVVLAISMTLVASVIPSTVILGRGLLNSLDAGGRATGGPGASLRRLVLFGQAALCTVLLAGSGMFVQSLRRASSVDLGYDIDRLALIGVDRLGRNADQLELIHRQIESVPGIESVAESLDGLAFGTGVALVIEKRDTVPGRKAPEYFAVGPGFFQTVGLRVVRGRALSLTDYRDPQRVAVVSESMAAAYWNGDAVGKSMCTIIRPSCRTIVGVVRDVRQNISEETRRSYFVPLRADQLESAKPSFMFVRTRARPTAETISSIRTVIQNALAISQNEIHVSRFADRFEKDLRPLRLATALFGAFGLLGLIAAGFGLYSLVAFNVVQKTREVAIRLAVGASRPSVVALIVESELRHVLIGVAVGAVLSVVEWRLFVVLLYESSLGDMIVLPIVAAVLVATSIIASYGPANRIVRMNLSAALRSD